MASGGPGSNTPPEAPFGVFLVSFSSSFFEAVSESILVSFWAPFGSHLGSKFKRKSSVVLLLVFEASWDAFFEQFWGMFGVILERFLGRAQLQVA